MNDITYCSALFCPLEDLCERKSYIGKPSRKEWSFSNFSASLKKNEDDEYCCEDGIEVECK